MKRILVADDSVTIQKVIALTFAEEPFEVQSVGTGSEALELVKNWKPDIVLADVIMPQMNGYELCRAVKQQEETSSVPVMLLAGTFEAFDEEEAKSVGANDFITKPFESGELIEKVKVLIGEMPEASPMEQVPEAPLEEQAPEAPSVEQAPVAEKPIMADEPAPMPEVVPQAEAPSPAADTETSEPDIWDILSESGDDAQPPAADSDAQAPTFGPIEDTGVVDVGSFDVGIGRPESQPPPGDSPPEPSPEPVQIDDLMDVQPGVNAEQPPEPPVAKQELDLDEKSRVENMEKDFFGFETGAVEEASATDIFEEAVEEVTFEMEQTQSPSEGDIREASFVVPEPADDQVIVTGDTLSPDTMAPEPPSVPSFAQVSADPVEGKSTETVKEPEFAPAPAPPSAKVPEPDPTGIPGFIPETAPGGDGGIIEEVVPESVSAPESAQPPAADVSLGSEPQLEPEPPLDLPVDLIAELPEEIAPEQGEQSVADAPAMQISEPVGDIPAAPAPVQPVPDALSATEDVPSDEAIRKIVEEKVEKIVWEVVPDMAEVIIREAIQKIKDGS